ncbi:HTH-type transcriptional regulator BhcR [Nereida sp. MMG025]|uniref:HTH-type transcriptional regulator BhcR n=1 Tax=Nereida sp. MMG025 TaxID=2909981 RepID=UPI001F43415D|nr:HTH-type transcriptional regulator BhcR [Nereida sp. MMG025]MCF6443742.1 IclR family transcriptional regulator [Nereida sp. MMG025]
MDGSEKQGLAGRRARGRPRDWNDKTDQNTIKSLDRAMEVFEYLSEAQGKALTTIASEMKQSPATLYRVLTTLEGRGLVEFDTDDQTWHIGSKAFVIGARFLRRTSLVDRARPILRKLMFETGETANLGAQRDGAVLFLSQVETHSNIRAFFPPGSLSPMHSSGIGKALLAEMTPEQLALYLNGHSLEAFTPHTITSAQTLSVDLEKTRARGFAIDGEEKNLGMRCIAAPVFDVNSEAVAGISVSGPTSRVGLEDIPHLAAAVMEAAVDLTHAIGGAAPR